MLIKSTPDRYDKLRTLGGMVAADDILTGGAARSEDAGSGKFASGYATSGPNRVAYSDSRKNPAPGIYKSSLPNGKKINLMRVMFTDFCKMGLRLLPQQHLRAPQAVRLQAGGVGGHLHGAAPAPRP